MYVCMLRDHFCQSVRSENVRSPHVHVDAQDPGVIIVIVTLRAGYRSEFRADKMSRVSH